MSSQQGNLMEGLPFRGSQIKENLLDLDPDCLSLDGKQPSRSSLEISVSHHTSKRE